MSRDLAALYLICDQRHARILCEIVVQIRPRVLGIFRRGCLHNPGVDAELLSSVVDEEFCGRTLIALV